MLFLVMNDSCKWPSLSRIDMYVEGLRDLSDMIMYFPLSLPEEKEMNLEYILQRATTRFFPVYEKVSNDLWLLHGSHQRERPSNKTESRTPLVD